MSKLLGYCEMKKTVGKVLFLVDEDTPSHIVGYSTDKAYFYGDNSKKIDHTTIGKDLELKWEKGFNDKAKLIDVDIK